VQIFIGDGGGEFDFERGAAVVEGDCEVGGGGGEGRGFGVELLEMVFCPFVEWVGVGSGFGFGFGGLRPFPFLFLHF